MRKITLVCLSFVFISCSVLLGPSPKELKKDLPEINISFSLHSGNYDTKQVLTISSEPSDATVYYIINSGKSLNCNNGIKYEKNKTIDIEQSLQIKAIACKQGYKPGITQAEYIIKDSVGDPFFENTLPETRYEKYRDVSIIAVPSDAIIYYTLNKTTPVTPASCGASSQGSTYKYDAPIKLTTYKTITAIACKGSKSSDEITGRFTIPFYHVSANGNDINNDGSAEFPYQTFVKANNVAIKGDTIKVVQGNYSLSDTFYLKSGVILKGGYASNSNFKNRDIFTHQTIINLAIWQVSVITLDSEDSVLDGFFIIAPSENISPSENQTIAIEVKNGSNAIIRNNYIFGGKSDQSIGGSSDQSIGVNIVSTASKTSKPTIYNNFIHGGNTNEAIGINNEGAASNIWNNTIFAGTGNNTTGIDLKSPSKVFIANNLIFCSNTSHHKEAVKYPNGNSEIKVTYNHSAGCSQINNGEGNTYEASPDYSEYFVDFDISESLTEQDWSLKSIFSEKFSKDVVNAGTNFANDFNFNVDFFGNIRTNNWSIGAHELD